MKEIDERYITALDELGFEMFRTKAGVNICHTTSTGSFMINLNGEDFVDMLVSYAETFDPNTYVSLKVKSHSSTQDISAVLKNAQEIHARTMLSLKWKELCPFQTMTTTNLCAQ